MCLRRLTDRICTIHILYCLNSCTSLLSIKNNRTWQDLTQANTKLPLHLPNLESKLDYYSMSPTNSPSHLSHLSNDKSVLVDLQCKYLVLPCRSSTFKRPSVFCCVRDSAVGSDDNEPLAPLLCNPDENPSEMNTDGSLRSRHIREEINQIIALCIFSSNMRTFNRVRSHA